MKQHEWHIKASYCKLDNLGVVRRDLDASISSFEFSKQHCLYWFLIMLITIHYIIPCLLVVTQCAGDRHQGYVLSNE